jgi:hypothetical protein
MRLDRDLTQAVALRVRIVLACAEGEDNGEVAERVMTLGGFPLERLNPSIQVAVGPAKQAFHFTDLLANLLANRHEFLRELLIQAGDPFRDEADVRAQTFSHDVEMAFEIIKSSIALLVHDADLAPQPISHDVEMSFDLVGCLAIHRSSCLPRLAPRLISIVAAFRSTTT